VAEKENVRGAVGQKREYRWEVGKKKAKAEVEGSSIINQFIHTVGQFSIIFILNSSEKQLLYNMIK
jgi:hypothetical protein